MDKVPFNFEEIDDFDKHISLSIPNYDGLIDIITALYLEHVNPNGLCIDIGCSTGNLLSGIPKVDKVKYVGCDIVDIVSKDCNFDFVKSDCAEYLKTVDSCDVIFSIFTLQFLGKHKRLEVVKEIKRLVADGAVLIIAEKNYGNSSKIDSVLRREHLRQKRKNFTDKEIMDKDYQLFGSMFCQEASQMADELSGIGKYEQVWQSYNFKSWIVY